MPFELSLSVLVAAVCIDAVVGDPFYRWHPIRLLGGVASVLEHGLFTLGRRGRAAGLLYLLLVTSSALACWTLGHVGLAWFSPALAWLWDVYFAASLLCLRGLWDQGRRVLHSLDDLAVARGHMVWLVGRDTASLGQDGLVRATIESLAENLTDAVLTPWWAFCLFGLPGLIVVKVISTLDAMVGYRNARYARFGWAAARADDLIHWLPARLSVPLIMVAATLLGQHPRLAWQAAWRYRKLLPSPNSGWSEAAFAGALRVRLLGPVWYDGVLVNAAYLGDPAWPADLTASHLHQALDLLLVCVGLAVVSGLAFVLWAALYGAYPLS